MRKLLDSTWKDEALSFLLLVAALLIFMRATRFFLDSQAERSPDLSAYRESVPERMPPGYSGDVFVAGHGSALSFLAFDTAMATMVSPELRRIVRYRD